MSKKRILFRSGLLTLSLVCWFFIYRAEAEETVWIWTLDSETISACNLSPDWTVLDCSNRGIYGIAPWAFVDFPNIKTLHLYKNNLWSLDEWVFEWLNSLEHLNLEYNNIREFNEDSFEWIKWTLKKLFLFNAWIYDIAPETFSGMVNLEELTLENNNIEYLSVNTFKWLSSLKKLSINGNYGIICYPMWLFSWMDNVEIKKDRINSCLTYENVLDVCDWDWETQTLDCSNRDIEFIPEYAFEMAEAVESSDPTEYYPENVINFNLSGNKIEHMTLNSLYWLDSLKYLNLKWNPLWCYPDLNWEKEEGYEEWNEWIVIEVDDWVSACLELNADNLLKICDRIGTDYYVTLDCSNRWITNIAIWTFGTVGRGYNDNGRHRIASILLNNNKIFYIEPNTFSNIYLRGPNVALDLSYNKLTRLDAWTFYGFDMWTDCTAGDNYIYLNNNQISEIEPWAFAWLSMIASGYNHIYLDNNQLSWVKEWTFRWLYTALQNPNDCMQ